MHRPMDSSALTDVSAVLEGLSDTVAAVEDSLLSCLVVMGEPHAQATVDGWVDQVVDLLRAVDEVTGHHQGTLSRVAARRGEHDGVAPARAEPGSAAQHDARHEQSTVRVDQR